MKISRWCKVSTRLPHFSTPLRTASSSSWLLIPYRNSQVSPNMLRCCANAILKACLPHPEHRQRAKDSKIILLSTNHTSRPMSHRGKRSTSTLMQRRGDHTDTILLLVQTRHRQLPHHDSCLEISFESYDEDRRLMNNIETTTKLLHRNLSSGFASAFLPL